MIHYSVYNSIGWETYENRFYYYLLNENELTLTVIDSRLIANINRWLSYESYIMNSKYENKILSINEENNIIVFNPVIGIGDWVLSVDEANNSVVYHMEDGFYPSYLYKRGSYFYSYKNGIYFGGNLYHGEYFFHPSYVEILEEIK